MTPPTPLLMVSMPANVEAMLMAPELFRVLRPPPKLAAGPAPSLAVHVPILLKTLLPSGRLMRPSNVPALLMTIWPVVTGEEIARSWGSAWVDRIPPVLVMVVVPVPRVAEMTGLATEPIPSTMLLMLMLMLLLPAAVLVAMAVPPVAEMLPLLMLMALLPASVLVAMPVPPVAEILPPLMLMALLLPMVMLAASAPPPVHTILPPFLFMSLIPP